MIWGMKVITKSTLITLCLVFCLEYTVQAQLERSHIYPSPNVSGALSASNVDMNHYTGTANISVPLHVVAGRDIAIPVSFDYRTTGIKVQDISSSVGLGWSLNANAFAVTRVVRGVPDGSKPNCSVDGTGKITRESMWNSHFEHCDSERDIFYFNHPAGNGKLFLDNSGQPQTIPYQDIVVQPGVGSASIGYWKITDTQGFTYFFGETSASREETTYSVGSISTNTFTDKYTFISTWYLNKIVSPSGIQIATFNYTSGSNTTNYLPGVRVLECQASNIPNTRVDTKITSINPKYILSISTEIASCNFFYDNNRQDLQGALRLTSVSFRDQSSSIKKRFELEHGCFNQYLGFGVCRGLKLMALKEGITNKVTTNSFLYEETVALPGPKSFYTDHFGYFNVNSTYDENIGASGGFGYSDDAASIVSGICTNGRSKAPNSNTLAAILKEIQTHSGQRIVLAYSVDAGAIITSISSFIGSSLVSRSTFTYQGETYRTPVYHYYDVENSNKLIRSSNSYNGIFDLNGVNRAYSTVTETKLDGSKVIRSFYNFSDYPDSIPTVGRYRGTPAYGFTYYGATNVDSSPFTPYSSNAWLRGLPKSVTIKDSDGNTLSIQEFTFEPGPIISTVWNMAVEVYRTVPGDFGFYVGDYKVKSQIVKLTESISYLYDQNGYTTSLADKTTYTYHPVHKTFPSSITRQVGNGPEEKVTYRYPTDVAGTGSQNPGPQPLADGIRTLVQQKIITPIEQVSWFKDYGESSFKITGASLKTFHKNTILGTPALNSVYSLVIDAPIQNLNPEASLTSNKTVFSFDDRYRPLESYNYNESTSTLSTVQKSDGLTSSFQWLNNTLLSSVTVNPGTNQQKTEYQYNSIYGLTQSKDMNDRLTKYEFDNQYGQLLRIRDNENNIIERYRYHYKNQPEQLSNSSIFNYGCRMVGIETTLSSPENTSYGQTTYHWDFGDGTSTSTTNSSVGKVYQSAGNYTVKVRKENPEYYSLETSSVVTIFNQASNLTIIPNGETSIDNCSDIWWGYATELQASATGDVQSFSWEYQAPGSSWWWSLGSGPVVYTPPGFYHGGITGTYLVKCTMTNYCGNTFDEYIYLFVYASDPFCPQY